MPAQTGEVLEEIVVSGFRPADHRDLPSSVAVLDAAMVDATVVQHFEELTHFVPNLNWAGGASRPRYFQIRGIGERSQYEGAPNPSVGFIVDDIDFSALGGIATMFDVEQVEVLRGPQGTRYGANALAGLIYVKYRSPGETFDGRVSVSAGSDGTQSLGAAFGGPVSDHLAYRAVVQTHRNSGFRDNAYLGRDDTNGRDELTGRIKLRLAPDGPWRADLTTIFVELDNGYDAFAIDNGFTTWSNRPGSDSQRSLGAALNVSGALSNAFSLHSITSAARSDVVFSFDADWGNEEFWSPFLYDFFSETVRDKQNLSQELRVVSTPGHYGLEWVAGVHVADIRESNITRDDGNFEGFAFASQIGREYAATSTAFFGSAQFRLAERLTLDAGLRYEMREARYHDTAGAVFDANEDSTGGELALVYELSAASRIYSKVSRGYKAGGFNLGLPAEAGNDALLFDAEYLWNYEAGIKGIWMDGRLGLDLSGFWMQRRDQQVQTSTQLDPNNPATFVFLTDNVGEGSNAGIELGVDLAATDNLRLYAGLGLLYTEIQSAGSDTMLAGRDQAHAPRYTFALGGRQDFANGWYARLDVTGKDEFYFSDSHDQKSDSYALVNARLGVDRERWSLFLWGRNLTDERYAVRGFYFGNEPARDFADTLYTRLGDPRQVGVSFEYRYLR